ncbi:helix-turn-helix domain-containing protein [Mycobacterium tuberculosis]|uniref:helix-turn-helix domain-containing protein n=1 Tax=Mycobacterium tuberculosis TaxID=1773 RepID=UPI0009305B08|nr:helix-turn-helix transcriptional regulator [Mycobacterium tuberculosis]
MKIGQRLQSIRKSHNLTLNRLHEITGISRATLSLWENDKILPGMGSLERWAQGVGIDVWDIFFTPSDYEVSSAEEIQLIELYRQLSPDNQRLILSLMKNLVK